MMLVFTLLSYIPIDYLIWSERDFVGTLFPTIATVAFMVFFLTILFIMALAVYKLVRLVKETERVVMNHMLIFAQMAGIAILTGCSFAVAMTFFVNDR